MNTASDDFAITETVLPNGRSVHQVAARETRLLYDEIFVDRCYAPPEITLSANDTVVDVGANIGLASLFFEWETPGLQVVALEPATASFSALQRNLATAVPTAVAVNAGVGATRGVRDFVFYPGAPGMSGFNADPDEDARLTTAFLAAQGLPDRAIESLLRGRFDRLQYRVKITTLSEVLDEYEITRVDLLKIDCEKSELDVLLGLKKHHWPRIRQIVCEVHDLKGELANVRTLLEENGLSHRVERSTMVRDASLHMVYGWRS